MADSPDTGLFTRRIFGWLGFVLGLGIGYLVRHDGTVTAVSALIGFGLGDLAGRLLSR